ncbi:heavy-metal-associated domain-containing protein [Clostridium aminobutyricum]|uniref:Heavy-metal-associated domain-containing protein n=1 Tax=Clostridium aminobutyricum TaxID=33953 RepID=A0A939D7G0_CLOAM|nr:heavy metal-associated domain-containing protein [Clostridium aminobutyricum]MBN7772491.1 heavy-metal-associated domain-containing protein [Clostridium aminobutyricum]
MKKKIFIEGMSCEHCVKHVKDALSEVVGVEGVDVNLAGNYAIVETNDEVSDEQLKETIEEVDYSVTNIETL